MLIGSLTSYYARFEGLQKTLESLLKQTIQPDKWVLVVTKNDYRKMSIYLIDFCIENNIEILIENEDIKSYKKLLPTAEKYSDADIITFDDDIIYNKDVIESLVKVAEENYGSIVSRRGREIKYKDGKIGNYAHFPLVTKQVSGSNYIFNSGSGTYFPNIFFVPTLFDINAITKLCPEQDDLWFWIISVIYRIPVIILGKPNFIEAPNSSITPLWAKNCFENDNAIQRLLEYFPKIKLELKDG